MLSPPPLPPPPLAEAAAAAAAAEAAPRTRRVFGGDALGLLARGRGDPGGDRSRAPGDGVRRDFLS